MEKEKITSVRLIKRQEAVLTTTDNNEITGTLVADFSFEENWSKSVKLYQLGKRENIFVPLKKARGLLQAEDKTTRNSDFDWKTTEFPFSSD